MGCPCETRTSTCRSFATISSGLYRFLAITVLLDVKDIPQVGPLQWGRINEKKDKQRLYPTRQDLHHLPWTFAGWRDSERSSPLFTHSGRVSHERRFAAHHYSRWRPSQAMALG